MSTRGVAKPILTTNDEKKLERIVSPVGEIQLKAERKTSISPSSLPLATITVLNRSESLKYSRASSQMSDFSWTISEFSEGDDDGEGIDSQDWLTLSGELKETHIENKPDRIFSRIHSLTMSEIHEFESAYHDQQFSNPFDTKNNVEEVTTNSADDIATTAFQDISNAEIAIQESLKDNVD